ncbi:TPA: ferredoxin, partial [Neisseria gonorrhoeae]
VEGDVRLDCGLAGEDEGLSDSLLK